MKLAKLYVCGMGAFECWINGERVSDHVMEPGWTDFRRTCFYTAYDVSEYFAEGENTENIILVKLGDCMFNVPGGRYVYFQRSYGKAKLLCSWSWFMKMASREYVVTDESWKRAKSPIEFCCIYGGEDFEWKTVDKGIFNIRSVGNLGSCSVCRTPLGELKPAPMEPLRVKEIYQPVSSERSRKQGYGSMIWEKIFGWARIFLKTNGSRAGQKVVLKTAEKLDENGRIDQSVTGKDYAWTYVLNDKKEQEFVTGFYVYRVPLCGDDRCCAGKRNFFTGGIYLP